MNWIDDLIYEYSSASKNLMKYKQSLDRNDIVEVETINGMISDLKFALNWMRKGRRPGSLKGVDRQNVYRRNGIAASLSSEERLELLDLLLSLSERERQCFLLHQAKGLTFQEIGDILNVSKASVQTFVRRAKHKMKQNG